MNSTRFQDRCGPVFEMKSAQQYLLLQHFLEYSPFYYLPHLKCYAAGLRESAALDQTKNYSSSLLLAAILSAIAAIIIWRLPSKV